jgi:hypothetical protein
MRKYFFSFISMSLLSLVSCKKERTPATADNPVPVGTTLSQGTFVSNAHTSSGTVKIVKNTNNKVSLVFQNFKTDNGPDLRVWLATNTSASSYVEVGVLTAVSGNFSYELNTSVNYAANNTVLIWCEDFSVLFGHAVLQ